MHFDKGRVKTVNIPSSLLKVGQAISKGASDAVEKLTSPASKSSSADSFGVVAASQPAAPNPLGSLLGAAVKAVGDVVSNGFSVGNVVTGAINAVGNVVSGVLNSVKEVVSGLWQVGFSIYKAIDGGHTSIGDIKTGLGEGVEELVAMSPTLQRDIKQLEKEGWTVQFGPENGGSHCNNVTRTIVIDANKKGDPTAITATLAHEVGHALYSEKPNFSTKEAYLNYMFSNEGAAELKRIAVQREILAKGGPDIVAGYDQTTRPKLNEIYDQYLIDGDAAKAHKAIGDIFADNMYTSSSQGTKTYREQYGEWYDKYCSNAFKKFFIQLGSHFI